MNKLLNYTPELIDLREVKAAIMLLLFSCPIFFANAQEEDEDVLVMSPFIVTADDTIGYQATSTLAGTRLRTDLRDLGSAISVVTPELFEDTGAVDAATILSYTLGTEVGGVQGNFSDGLGRNHNNRATQDTQRLDSENSQRIRGLSSATLTRNFYITNIPFDSYNTNRVDISRGANSLLFGIGEPGGIINNSTLQAFADGNNFGSVSARIGERNSLRLNADFHHVLVEDRLAIRLATLHEEFNYQQEPAYERDRRIYMAFEGIILRNEDNSNMGPLKIRGSAEIGEIEGTPPNIFPPGDSFTSWWELPDAIELTKVPGVQVPFWHPQASQLDPSLVKDWVADPADYPRYHPEIGLTSWSPQMVIDSRLGLDPFSNIPIAGDTPGNWDVGIRFQDPNDQNNMVVYQLGTRNGDPRTRTDLGFNRRMRELVSQSFFASQRNGQTIPNFTVPVIMNRDVWDNTKGLITGNTNFVSKKFEAYNAVIEQTFFENNLGIELGFDQQRFQRYGYLPFNSQEVNGDTGQYDVYLDLTTHYANGDVNPNFGRPMMISRDVGSSDMNVTRTTEREAYRATAFYNIDLEEHFDKLGGWLGEHTFTAFLNEQSVENHNTDWSLYWSTGADPDIAHRDGNAWDRRVRQRVYLGPSALNMSSPDQLQIQRMNVQIINEPGVGFIANNWSNEPAGVGSAQQYDYSTQRYWNGVGRNKTEISTWVLSWQGRLLKDHLVLLYGYREDDPSRFDNITRAQAQAMGFDNRLPGLGGGTNPDFAQYQDEEVPGIESRVTRTASAVLHIPDNYLPDSTGLSFHWGESENFDLSTARRNIYGEVLPPPVGETEEYGFSVSLFDNKLVARFNWYETISTGTTHTVSGDANAYSAGAGGITWWLRRWTEAAETISFAEAVANVTPAGMTFPYSSYEEVFNEIISWTPDRVMAFRNLRVDSSDPTNIEILSEPNPGQSVTRDTTSEGFEIDLTWNIKPHWRLALNVAQQEAMQSNTAPALREVFEDVQTALLASPLLDFLDYPLAPDITYRSRFDGINVPAIRSALAFDNAKVQELREWRYNLITNYEFIQGKFEGLGVGGSLRWQGESAVGYPNIIVDGAAIPDVNNPFLGEAESNIDAWISYKRKITDKIDWKIQLNVRNLIGDDDYIPVVINPDGNVAVVRNPNPQEFFITNTFSF